MNHYFSGFIKEAAELSIKQHQQRVADKLKTQDALLVYHNMGAGKTMTALNAADSLHMPLTVIGPASLRNNFDKEKKKHHLKTKIHAYTYNKPPEHVSNKDLVVFDEAHNMGQMQTQRSHLADTIHGGKNLYLTGTPIKNAPSELIPLLRSLGIKTPRDAEKFNHHYIKLEKTHPGFIRSVINTVLDRETPTIQKAQNLGELKSLLKGKVDYYKPSSEGYPTTKERDINVDMTPTQEAAYKMVVKQHPDMAYKVRYGLNPKKSESGRMNAFLTASRQVSNYPGDFNLQSSIADAPKILGAHKEILKRFNQDPNYRGVSYSQYLGHGINPLASLLSKSKIPFASYTGELSQKQKDQIVNDYNNGKIKHLLISGAGSAGLDLRGTKILQILEPHWNDAQLDQVKGRAVRYLSHAHLPENERNVEIQNFIARPREHGFFFKRRDQGTDEYLRQMSKRKTDLNNQFLDVLKDVGSQ